MNAEMLRIVRNLVGYEKAKNHEKMKIGRDKVKYETN